MRSEPETGNLQMNAIQYEGPGSTQLERDVRVAFGQPESDMEAGKQGEVCADRVRAEGPARRQTRQARKRDLREVMLAREPAATSQAGSDRSVPSLASNATQRQQNHRDVIITWACRRRQLWQTQTNCRCLKASVSDDTESYKADKAVPAPSGYVVAFVVQCAFWGFTPVKSFYTGQCYGMGPEKTV
jgi:hypothetical protein